MLAAARGHNAVANLRRRFPGTVARDFPEFDRRHFHVQINAVKQRPGNPAEIILDFARRRSRLPGHFSVRRRVHRRHQHELRGKGHRPGSARNGHPPFFQRLAHGFQNAALELRQFVQKQNAVVGERDFTGSRIDVAPQQTRVAGGMMGRAKRTPRHQCLARRQQTDNAVNFGRLERLIQSERRQNRRQPFGEHGFAGPGRANQQYVMSAGCGNFQCALHVFLAFDLGEIQVVIQWLIENSGDVHLRRRDSDFAGEETGSLTQVLDRDDL